MKHLVLLASLVSLLGCAAAQPNRSDVRAAREPDGKRALPPALEIRQVAARLGLDLPDDELGFSERKFDGCSLRIKGDSAPCGARYLARVQVQLVCRDTDETVTTIVRDTQVLASTPMKYQFAEGERVILRGQTTSDANGVVQLLLFSDKAFLNSRLGLTVGYRSVGKEIAEMNGRPIVLPNAFCRGR